jgi:hypothetical protein
MRVCRPLLRLSLSALALCALAFAVGCGGDDSDASDANPRSLLSQAAAKKIDSAEVSLRTTADIPGFPILGSELAVTGGGPFVANGPDALPSFDWKVLLRAGGQSFPAQVSGVDGKVYVQFMGQYYEADADLLKQLGLGDAAGRPAATSLKQFGIDPSDWLTSVKVSDGEDIGGDSTRVVTGRVAKQAVIEDLLSTVDTDKLEEAGKGIDGLPEIDDDNIDKVADAVDTAKVEVNVDDDGYPRRVYAKLRFTVPKDVKDTAIKTGTVTFDLVLDEIGDVTVDVQPPFDPDPLSSLFKFAGVIFGIDEPSDLWRTPN